MRTPLTKDQARDEATKIANAENIIMVVLYERYAEEPDDSLKFGYCPKNQAKAFMHDEVVETIHPES